jgi:capsular exopolysaccharide synthesis family protein
MSVTGPYQQQDLPGKTVDPEPLTGMMTAPDVARLEDEPGIDVMDYVNLIWARRWMVLLVVAVAVVGGAAWALTRPKLYRSFCEISVGERSPKIVRNQLDMGPSWWELERYVDEQVRVLSSRNLAARAVEKLGLGDSVAPELLRSMIAVERLGDTNMIRLVMIAREPEQAADWLNRYVQEYIKINIDDNLVRARQVFEVIQERLDPLRADLARSERELMQFKERENAILFADQDKNVITEQVNTLTTEYARAKAERIRLDTKLQAIRRLQSEDISDAVFPEVQEDATIRSLTDQRNLLEVELTEKLGTYREGHPTIRELRSRLAATDERVAARIASLIMSFEADLRIVQWREESLFRNIQLLKQEAIELSKQTMEYERLKREYEQNKTFLENMMARSKEVDISSSTGENNIRVIEPAVPARAPFSPNINRTLIMSLILGFIFGVGLALGLDLLDQSLRTPEQVERYIGLDVLTVLPKHVDRVSSIGREALLALRTALMLASRGEGCHVVMVTSAVPGEGKTTVAVEMAAVLAESGSRVVVIDADLRKSRIHRMIGVENTVGLTSVVLGENPLEEVIHRSQMVPNLDLITSGPLPPNPPELFGKATFERLLAKAREHYDWVVIDTPPVASVTDPVVCSRLVDMVLLVVEYGGVKRQTVREAVRQLARASVRIAGAVLNKVDMEQHHYYYYSRYSYYRYGYSDEEN